jgi:hypothetical protein
MAMSAGSSLKISYIKSLLNMKSLLLFACGCALLANTGCLSSHEEWRGHANNAYYGGLTTDSPTVEVPVPAASMRPQQIITR